MERALNAYRADTAKKSQLTALYKDMMRLRCLEYLEAPKNREADTAYTRAVNDFLTGAVQAKAVSFKGHKLNGVFLIPVGAGGVLFSVDEEKFFHVGEGRLPYDSIYGRRETYSVPEVPRTTDFKDWVLSKMPAYNASEYKNEALSMFKSEVRYDHAEILGDIPRLDCPFEFTASRDHDDLADKLFTGLMDRLASDIDSLVFSRSEQMTLAALDVVKTILMVGAVALNVAVPGTGTLLSRVGLFLANLALDAAYVAAAATQAHVADRPQDAAAFRNEAIIAGVLGGVGTVAGGKALSREGVAAARSLYRQTKAASQAFIDRALGRVTWTKLSDAQKVTLLATQAVQSPGAGPLTRLGVSPAVVSQVVRNNLELDAAGVAKTRFAWSEDIAVEQARIDLNLQADERALSAAQGHMDRLLDNPPLVEYELLQGEVSTRAAEWVARRNGGAATEALQARVLSVLSEPRDTNLLDIAVIDRIHAAVNPATAGRTFRASGTAGVMGSDVARAGFEKALAGIQARVQAGTLKMEKVGGMLYAAVRRYQPFVHGNEDTARTLYALAQLKMRPSSFKALSAEAERLLGEAEVAAVAEAAPIAETAPAVELRRDPVGATSAELPADMRGYLGQLRADSEVAGMIANPKDQCFDILPKVRDFMQRQGMQDVKVRKMLLWSSPNQTNGTHYVLKGSKDGVEYIFDLTAGQFQGRLASLDGPLILPEAAWTRRYQTASTTNSWLMKYKDFDSISDANSAFGGRFGTPDPMDAMDGAYVMTEPGWYKQLQRADLGAPLSTQQLAELASERGRYRASVDSMLSGRNSEAFAVGRDNPGPD